MVFLIVAPPDPRGVLVKKIFINDPTPFLHFCNYLPFEKDLALNFNNLQFP
jgi:hypothetical protein